MAFADLKNCRSNYAFTRHFAKPLYLLHDSKVK
jgi:hypothetical protein